MLNNDRHASAAIAQSIKLWHTCIEQRDFSLLATLIHPEAIFRSPMAYQAYESSTAMIMILTTVIQVFENFTYHREFMTEEGNNIVLEFSANIGNRQLKGIDMIRFDEQGRIVEFEVMIRPFSGLQALGLAMSQRLGESLGPYQAQPTP